MNNNKWQNYWDDGSDGNVDSHHFNHDCEKPDPDLGRNLGIDVAG